MPGAVIVADQSAGAGAGSPGVARKDLWQGRAVSLYLGVGGNTTYLWELLNKPTGSASVLTSSTASTSEFTPDLVGTYRVRLTVNGGGPGNVQTRVYRCRYTNAGALASRGWALPAYGETAAEANYGSNAIGYGEVFETILADILANLGGGGGGSVPTGTGIPHIVGGVQDAAASLIVNADVHASAAIAASKVVQATGTGIPHVVGGALSAASSLIVNADVDAAAAIALSKIVNPTGTGLVKATGGVFAAAASLLIDADVDAAAALAPSKLAPAGTNGHVLTTVGGVAAWAAAAGGAALPTGCSTFAAVQDVATAGLTSDLALTANAFITLLRFTDGGASSLDGVASGSNAFRFLVIRPVTSSVQIVDYGSSASAAANQFESAAALSVAQHGGIFAYDPTSQRWLTLGHTW
jgi:hypothetical protein